VSVDVKSLGIDRLSVKERLELIEQIWDSLPQQVDAADIPAWRLAEIMRRRQEAEQNPGAGKPFDEILNSLRQKP
jgi:putative addiction module component (TIGR02574 family)